MKVQEVMTRDVKTCGLDTNLAAASEMMWANDCGILPVVDDGRKVIGLITDRDICIAVGTKNRPASETVVGEVISGEVFACAPDDDVRAALGTIREAKVRRLPVVDRDGAIQGILSLNDVVLRAEKANGKKAPDISYEDVVTACKAICEHRAEAGPQRIATA